LAEFIEAITLTKSLVDRRNAVMHGTWGRVGPTAIEPVVAKGRNTSVTAKDLAELAADLRNARMSLLRLCNDYHPTMDGGNKCPHPPGDIKGLSAARVKVVVA